MAMTIVEICNLALVEAGYDETIESMDETSVAAQRCKRLYDVNRKELLCNYPWTFCTKFENLARVAEDIDGYKFAYSYPKDALRVLNVYSSVGDFKNRHNRIKRNESMRVGLHNNKKVVLCDCEKPYCEYVYDEKLVDNFSLLFVRLLYLTMALGLSKLSGADTDKIKILASQIQAEENKARVQSVGEDDNVLPSDEGYIIARG